jgi:hypothetical protein
VRGNAARHRGGGARSAGKLRKAEQGFASLVEKGGLWEVAKGKGRALTKPPQWLWEGLAAYAARAADLACRAADALSAARYFEVGAVAAANRPPLLPPGRVGAGGGAGAGKP